MIQRWTLGCGSALAATWVVFASAQEVASSPETLDKVEIVGSRIPRIEGEGPVPVTIIRREEIEASGAARISELLTALPYTSATASFDDRVTGRSPLLGAASASLRGVGFGATLLLLNGRRIVPYGIGWVNDESFVDLNSLPLAAVDRIEILRDGASALYGADALAGVINVVLRDAYRGAEAAVRWTRSTNAGPDEKFATLTIGGGPLSTDKFNVFAAIDLLRQTPLRDIDRDFSRTGDQRPRGGHDYRSVAGSPPTGQLLSDGTFHAAPNCPPQQLAALDATSTFCAYNNNEQQQLLPKVERGGALVVGTAELAADTKAFGEFSFNRTHTASQFAPTGVFNYPLAAGAPNNPFGEDVLLNWRFVEIEPRRYESTVDFARAVAGLRGRARSWDWEGAGGYNTTRTAYRRLNDLGSDGVEAALAAGQIDPFSTNNVPVLDALRVTTLDRYRSTQSFLQFHGSAELMTTANGPLALALGGEWRRESFGTRLDPVTRAGGLLGSAFGANDDFSGGRDIGAVFAEFDLPLAKNLEGQLAGRLDRYSDFGQAFSPKAAVRWRINKHLMARASAGRGFLPPSLFQLDRPNSASLAPTTDPVRCPVTGLPDDCIGRVVTLITGGNPALKAERSKQYNVGLVLEPAEGVSIAIDAWRIDDRNRVESAGDFLIQNSLQYPDRVIRAPASPADNALGIPGPIVEVRDIYINLQRQQLRGVDAEFKMQGRPADLGRVTFSTGASYLQRAILQSNPDEVPQNLAGQDELPRLKLSAMLVWERGWLQLDFAARYISPIQYLNGFDAEPRTVGSMTTFDGGVSVVTTSTRITLQVRNVFDRQPPFRDFFLGYDPFLHDPRGRLVSLSVRHTF